MCLRTHPTMIYRLNYIHCLFIKGLKEMKNLKQSNLIHLALLTISCSAFADGVVNNYFQNDGWKRVFEQEAQAGRVGEKEILGQKIFFDQRLSSTETQSCASCHSPTAAFSDPTHSLPTSKGAVAGRFGGRNAPTAMYMKFNPPFGKYKEDGENETIYKGGQFWDGRASRLEDQAKGPFLNPAEMNNADAKAVIEKIASGPYAEDFKKVYGQNSLNNVDQAYNFVADAIASFERTKVFAPFSSKYDFYLAGKAQLSEQELRGLKIYNNPKKANCVACHNSLVGTNGEAPLFTDFSYDNLGLPRNPEIFNGTKDIGLQQTTKSSSERGLYKVPSLRNIAITAPYMHNGYFKTLRGVIDFYNSRDVKPKCKSKLVSEADALKQKCWPVPEITSNVNREELGKLKMTASEMADLEAFLLTLTDGYQQ